MKKNLLAAALSFAFTSAVFSQQKGKVEFGAGVGLNYSTATTDNFSADTGFGVNVAVGADYYFSDRWSIKAKLVYDQKGWNNGFYENYETSYDPNFDGTTYKTNFNLNYLTIPLMANWHFGGKRNWYLNFGPYVGFLVSAKETEGGVDVKDYFNSTDFGATLGIGVKIPVSDRLKLYFEYSEQAGFSDIAKDNEGASIRNSRGGFSAGLNFMMK